MIGGCRAATAYAIANELAEVDPSTAVRHALSAAPIAGEQLALTTLDDARELLAASTAAGGPAVVDLASRFLALTAVRLGTLRGMRWHKIEGLDWTGDVVGPAAPVWRVPAVRMKLAKVKKGNARFDHFMPLSRQAVEILRIVRALGIDADFVFGHLSESAIGGLYRKAGFAGRHVRTVGAPHSRRS